MVVGYIDSIFDIDITVGSSGIDGFIDIFEMFGYDVGYVVIDGVVVSNPLVVVFSSLKGLR